MTVATAVGRVWSRPRTSSTFPGKYLSVTAFRRSGDPVSTPVWFVEHEGRLYVDTDGESGKVRRIRANPHVLVAPCTATGKVKAAPVAATAEVVESGKMPSPAGELYARKYRVDKVLVLPLYRLSQAAKRTAAREQHPVVLVITPTGA